MDSPAPPSWSPRPAPLAATGALGAVLLVLGVTLAGDVVGMVLLVLGGLVAAAYSANGALARPRLSLVADGIRVRPSVFTTRTHPRNTVRRVHLLTYPRFGMRVPMLELEVEDADGGERLEIFSRWDLGMHPREVAAVLADAGYPTD